MKKPLQVRILSFTFVVISFTGLTLGIVQHVWFCKYFWYLWEENCIVTVAITCFPGTSAPCYNDVEMLTEFSWDDCNIRRVFIRKVGALSHATLVAALALRMLCITNNQHQFSNINLIKCLFQVYTILMIQLFVTLAVVAVFTFWWVSSEPNSDLNPELVPSLIHVCLFQWPCEGLHSKQPGMVLGLLVGISVSD